MLFATRTHAVVFLATVYAGLVIGVLYDGDRILRRLLAVGRMGSMIVDGLFWSVVCLWCAKVLFEVNGGELRAFALLGFAVGWALYEWAISPLLMGLWDLLCAAGHKIGKSRQFQLLMK